MLSSDSVFLAETEGFEPPVPRGTMVFKTTAFDHSATSPVRNYNAFLDWQGVIEDFLILSQSFLNVSLT